MKHLNETHACTVKMCLDPNTFLNTLLSSFFTFLIPRRILNVFNKKVQFRNCLVFKQYRV